MQNVFNGYGGRADKTVEHIKTFRVVGQYVGLVFAGEGCLESKLFDYIKGGFADAAEGICEGCWGIARVLDKFILKLLYVGGEQLSVFFKGLASFLF